MEHLALQSLSQVFLCGEQGSPCGYCKKGTSKSFGVCVCVRVGGWRMSVCACMRVPIHGCVCGCS